MGQIDYIAKVVNNLTTKYGTRNPYEICKALGIKIRYKDLGIDIKAYYFYQSRIRNIVLSTRVSESVQRILVSHELGHDRLHQEMAMQKGFQEIALFDEAQPAEYEANLFAAELLIDDDELCTLLSDEEKSFFGVAQELSVPAELLDFKFRVFKRKGFRVCSPIVAHANYLRKI